MNHLTKIALILLAGATVSRMVRKKNHEITVCYRLKLSEDEINRLKEKQVPGVVELILDNKKVTDLQ